MSTPCYSTFWLLCAFTLENNITECCLAHASLAVGTDALDDVFRLVHKETLRQCYRRYLDILETVGLSATDARKMYMVGMVAVFATAEAVFLLPEPIVNLMQQLVLRKQAQGTEDAGTVHLGHALLQVM